VRSTASRSSTWRVQAVDRDETTTGDSEPVQAPHVAVPEDPDLRPVGVVSGSSGTEVQIAWAGEMESKDDFEMREVF
jgi:hypothetical protein